MKIESVKYSAVKNSVWRFDPSFHLSEAVHVHQILEKSPYKMSTVDCCSDKVFLGNIFSRNFVKNKEHGVPYLAASDTVLTDIDTGAFLSKRQANELSYLMLEKDWILVTCSGTVGNVTYTNKCFKNHIATHDLIRIIPNDKTVKRGCLYAYLSSKYGHCLLTQSEFGGVVKHINDNYVRNIPIPQFPDKFQKKIDDLVKESSDLREKAMSALMDADNALSKFVDTKIQPQKFKTTVASSKCFSKSLHMRLDAPPYIYDCVSIMEKLKSNKKNKLLKDLKVEISYPGIFKRTYVKEGLPYIMGSSLMERNPFKSCDFLSRTKTPKLDQLWLRENQILITCAGRCGDAKIITKEFVQKKAIGSPDIIRVCCENAECSSEYLFVYLRHPLIKALMQSFKYGSVIERFDAEHIGSIPIILPDDKLSMTIDKLVKEYANQIHHSFELEENAISMVEKEIDGWNA